MSHIVNPRNVQWDFLTNDDGTLADVLGPNGTRNYFMRGAVDASGDITGLAGAGGKVYPLEYASGSSDLTATLDGDFGDWTHSRASANASVMDCNGTLQFALSGERRQWGALRSCNLIPETEALSTGRTLGANTLKTALNVRAPNSSRPCAYTISRSSGSAVMFTFDAQSFRPGQYTFSVYLRGDGVQTYTLTINATSQTVTPPSGVWTRCAVIANITSTSAVTYSITNASAGAASFDMCEPQMEWTHNTTGAPTDYTPRGVASFPAGLLTAGADGVRYYNTANPWSVASGICTRSALVTPLSELDLFGVMFEPDAVNQVYSSRDISAAEWAKSGSTTVNATPIDSTLLGKNSLFKIEEAAASSGYRVTQSWRGTNPAANAKLSVSLYFKPAERTIVNIGLRQLDGSSFTYGYFNTLTGVMSLTAGCKGFMRKEGDLWWIGFTGPAGSSGSTAPLIQVGMALVNGTQTYAGTLGEGAYFGAIQFEAAGTPSRYMGDTGSAATLTRVKDALSVSNDLMPAQDLTFEFEYTPLFPTDTDQKDSWWYAMSSYVSDTDRMSMGMRPGTFGGAGVGMEDEWFFDLYPGISPSATSWDGVEVLSGASFNPGETVKLQWSLATTAVTGASNQTGQVGATAATLTGDSPRPAVNSFATTPRTWWFGRQGESLPQRGPGCVKNLRWYSPAATATEMAVIGNE